MSKLGIYRYECDGGRNGSLSGLFIAPVGLPEKLVTFSMRICWGDVLGKHSDVVDTLDEYSFVLKSTNEQLMALMIAELGLKEDRDFEGVFGISGYNPFSQLTADDVTDREETYKYEQGIED